MNSYQCIECKNYRGALTCAAFPEGIPDRIVTGKRDHKNPQPGDNGIRFEPIEENR